MSSAEMLNYLYSADWYIDRVIEQQASDPRFADEWRLSEDLPALDAQSPDLNFEPAYEHQLTLPPDMQQQAKAVYEQATQDPAIRSIHALVEDKAPQVRQHMLRTAKAVTALGIYRGRPDWQVVLQAKAQLVDDAGKADERVMAALRSPLTFQQDPTLFDTIKRHSWISTWLCRAAGVDPAVIILVGNHHSRQPNGREAYSVFPNVQLVDDAYDRPVIIDDLLEDMQLTDMLDAMVRPESGSDSNVDGTEDPLRAYRKDQPGSYEAAYSNLVAGDVPVPWVAMESLRKLLPSGQPRVPAAAGKLALVR